METSLYGKSGTEYKFTVYDIDHEFNEVPAVYVFAKAEPPLVQGLLLQTFTPLYIGKTIHLDTRMGQHERKGGKLECAKRYGASVVLVHRVVALELVADARVKEIEDDLLGAYKTPCNIQNN